MDVKGAGSHGGVARRRQKVCACRQGDRMAVCCGREVTRLVHRNQFSHWDLTSAFDAVDGSSTPARGEAEVGGRRSSLPQSTMTPQQTCCIITNLRDSSASATRSISPRNSEPAAQPFILFKVLYSKQPRHRKHHAVITVNELGPIDCCTW
jgi:hypothetical protein